MADVPPIPHGKIVSPIPFSPVSFEYIDGFKMQFLTETFRKWMGNPFGSTVEHHRFFMAPPRQNFLGALRELFWGTGKRTRDMVFFVYVSRANIDPENAFFPEFCSGRPDFAGE
jgi:hypothetical protein